MQVVVAPDKFKGSLSAAQVAEWVAAGIAAVAPDVATVRVPVADGGDGTIDAALAAGFNYAPVRAEGPTGEPVNTGFAMHDRVAVVEMADVSGLQLLLPDRLAPLTASSYGLGEVVRAALDRGCSTVVLAIGGSASTDGGAGLLQGASSDDVAVLEAALTRWADVVDSATGSRRSGEEGFRTRPGAGAAGGVGYAAMAVLAGQLRPGIELVLELVDFAEHLAGARLVITGEGSLDEQTLSGKAPAGVAAAAASAGLPVVTVSGRLALTDDELRAAGIRQAYALTDIEPDVQRCITEAAPLLEKLAGRLARDWLSEQHLTTPSMTPSGPDPRPGSADRRLRK